PIVTFLCKSARFPRWAAVAVAYIALLVLLALTILLGIPALVDAIRQANIDLPRLVMHIVIELRRWLESIRSIQFMDFSADLSPIVDPALEALNGVVPPRIIPSPERILESLPSALEMATGFASTVVSTVLSAILAFIFTLIYSIYLSLDMPRISRWIFEAIPPPYREEMSQLGRMIRQVWIAYLRGQLLLCGIIGTAVGLGTAALGLRGAVLLGILAGILEVLPTIGPVTAAIPAVIIALVQGSTVLPVSNFFFAVLVALFYWVIQQLENNIIVPRVIGDAIKVHPILVMAAVVIGVSVAGIFGALIASPVLATGRVLARYVYCKLLDIPPFPPEQPVAASEPERPPLTFLIRARLTGAYIRAVNISTKVFDVFWPIVCQIARLTKRLAVWLWPRLVRITRWSWSMFRRYLPRVYATAARAATDFYLSVRGGMST
ncbi:MAG: AI-2E family transporter, partial [Anaerolineae bacterium]|nr:AI-2E family transporter [Anaerolineae bacterium]